MNQFHKQHKFSIMFSAKPAIVTINIFLFNHTVCNQPLIRINETNLPWFSFNKLAGVLSLGRVSFIHHLYLKCVLLILENPENLPVSLLCCCCSLHQTLHSSWAFLLKPPSVCNIFLRGKHRLSNPMDSGCHTCCVHTLEQIIFCTCWNLPNGFNCFQHLVQPAYVATVRRCRARGHCTRISVKKTSIFGRVQRMRNSQQQQQKIETTSADHFT